MKYFAKSKVNVLSKAEKEKRIDILNHILQDMGDELTQEEVQCVKKQMEYLNTDSIPKHVTLREHETDIVTCAESFFERYGRYFSEKEKILVVEACRHHDWGKANLIFQSKVNFQSGIGLTEKEKHKKQVPHGFLSAVTISDDEFFDWSDELDEDDFEAYVTALFYHHTRKDEVNSQELEKYCECYYKKHIEEYLGISDWHPYCSYMDDYRLFENRGGGENLQVKSETWNKYVLLKGLLNKFDYVVSAGYSDAEDYSDLEEKRLKKNILDDMNSHDFSLKPAQIFMKENADKNLVVIAPTGSGKTEAALLWLNGEKGFYTLPLKVSSNAIYERIRDKYSYSYVELLHSDSMQRYLEESSDDDTSVSERYEKAKLLSAPLTVCTVDQLFKFVYRALGTEIFAATLKYSKIILDEVQAYSPRVIATIIYGLKQITEMGGHFAIITATFPPVLKYFMERYGLIEGEQYLFHDFSMDTGSARHMIRIRSGELDVDEITEQGKDKKVLVICNTVSKAQQVYESLSEWNDNVYLLHSRFIRQDRSQIEKMIMDFSNDPNQVGIWVTTQIVEASLDIDFDILYTEMCTADSLLQRMGRCNRKGRYVPERPNIIIYDNRCGVGERSVYDPYLYDRSLEMLQEYEEKLFLEEQKISYINRVYCTEEMKDSHYFQEIEKYLRHFKEIHPLEYSKEEANDQFRNIKSITVIPDSIYDRYRDLIENCLNYRNDRYLSRDTKVILNTKLNALTLSLNCYGKLPEGVDRLVIDASKHSPGTIHRTRMKYDFDEISGKGKGLLLNEIEDLLILE